MLAPPRQEPPGRNCPRHRGEKELFFPSCHTQPRGWGHGPGAGNLSALEPHGRRLSPGAAAAAGHPPPERGVLRSPARGPHRVRAAGTLRRRRTQATILQLLPGVAVKPLPTGRWTQRTDSRQLSLPRKRPGSAHAAGVGPAWRGTQMPRPKCVRVAVGKGPAVFSGGRAPAVRPDAGKSVLDHDGLRLHPVTRERLPTPLLCGTTRPGRHTGLRQFRERQHSAGAAGFPELGRCSKAGRGHRLPGHLGGRCHPGGQPICGARTSTRLSALVLLPQKVLRPFHRGASLGLVTERLWLQRLLPGCAGTLPCARSSKNSKVVTSPAPEGLAVQDILRLRVCVPCCPEGPKTEAQSSAHASCLQLHRPHVPPPQTDEGQGTPERPRPATDLCPGSLDLSPAASRAWWGDWKGRLCPCALAFGKSQGSAGTQSQEVQGRRVPGTPPRPSSPAWPRTRSVAGGFPPRRKCMCVLLPCTLTHTPAHVRAHAASRALRNLHLHPRLPPPLPEGSSVRASWFPAVGPGFDRCSQGLM